MPDVERRASHAPDLDFDTIAGFLHHTGTSLTEGDLVEGLRLWIRHTRAAELSEPQRSFWEEYSGIEPSDSAAGANAVDLLAADAYALSAIEVAELLKLSASTVRHYKADGRLYSYSVNGKLVFPEWQFVGSKALPSLEKVLHALPDDAHPQTIAGFFLTPQPDLVLHGKPVTPRDWLAKGGRPEPVIELAEDLAAGY